METGVTAAKGTLAFAGALFLSMTNSLAAILIALAVVMVIDWISGLTAAAKEGKLSSNKGLFGIIKKLCYGFGVAAAMALDWVILMVGEQFGISLPIKTFFGLLIIVWLIFNEIISITENVHRIGVPYPDFLMKALLMFKVKVEDAGEDFIKKNEKENK